MLWCRPRDPHIERTLGIDGSRIGHLGLHTIESYRVKAITQSDEGALVETAGATLYNADRVIVTVPTPLYRRIRFDPELPPAKKTLGDSTRLGYFSKTILVFCSPWWRDADLSGITSSATGPISFTRDTCVPEDEQYSITCFHVAVTGRKWSALPAEERGETVMKQFREMFGTVAGEIPEPIKMIEKEWTKDSWVQGAPSSVTMPGILTSEAGKGLRDPFGNIHFAGTETAYTWKGYMEGAVRAGERAAKEVISALS